MPLEVFHKARIGHLRAGMKSTYLPRYKDRSPWADKVKDGTKKKLFAGLDVTLPTLLPPAGDNLRDLENSKLVFEAFRHLTPLQARDPRLWTRLAHVEFWPYMRKRWDVGKHDADPGKAERYVLAHYFVTQAQSRALLRHGIARLWWYAKLTHDESRADPYQLTAVLLSYLDIAQQVLERSMGRAVAVRSGFLEYIAENKDRLGKSAGERRHRIRELAKVLNLRGGVTLLDTLSSDGIGDLLEIEMRLVEGV